MTAEIIEGTAVEIIPEVRAVAVVQQPGQALVTETTDPAAMVALASRLASVLKDIVDRQRLYADIRGKRYPTVEAWQTIGRLDNVVAREAQAPIRHDDGSYEAFVELIRLSDGMGIGAASALCGTKDDIAGRQDWSKQSEPSRRSMAVTRATSRAFRQQYSWIMALAGYEPTPAEEMPRDSETSVTAAPRPTPPRAGAPASSVSMAGTVRVGTGNGMDLSQRTQADGSPVTGFKLTEVDGHPNGNKSTGVRAIGAHALAILAHADTLPGQRVVVSGVMREESFDKKDKDTNEVQTVRYNVLVLETLDGPDFTVPSAVDGSPAPDWGEAPRGNDSDLDNLPW